MTTEPKHSGEDLTRMARVPSACLECNQAIEILVDQSGIETIIRVEENRRRELTKELARKEAEIEELKKTLIKVACIPKGTMAKYKSALEEAREFIRDVATNFDHDSDSHKYGTRCRVCEAEKELQSISKLLDGEGR